MRPSSAKMKRPMPFDGVLRRDRSLGLLCLFDEGAGGLSDNLATGQLVYGGTGWATSPWGPVITTDIGGYINCGNTSQVTPNQPFTVWALVSPAAFTSSFAQIVSKSDATANALFELRMSGTSTGCEFIAFVGGALVNSGTYDPAMVANSWYLIAGVYTGAALQVWVNGVMGASVVATGAVGSVSTANNVEIGGRNGGVAPYQGRIAAAGLHHRPFSSAEMSDLAADPISFAYESMGIGGDSPLGAAGSNFWISIRRSIALRVGSLAGLRKARGL